ncbi:unnamed protein product [Acanthoscelides obtectus]|uniref:Uncharacterized protein n=1 Tax=Acanthoscelides obtectus TaxID=200917 RepID=A0A9P0PLJ1_ACAOB|nr:unnamed protein product [Acanthoscelides obtectus]CAK1624647.1 hypothetical protein AOBTE_LOCUS2670 [Acanthoscelides obtectus]
MDVKAKDIFDVDPDTGQLIPLPIKWRNKGNKSEEKSATKLKQTFDLKPLKLRAADFEEDQPKAKKMKIETKTVRKGLFTASAPKPPQHRYSTISTSVARRSVVPRKIVPASEQKVLTKVFDQYIFI